MSFRYLIATLLTLASVSAMASPPPPDVAKTVAFIFLADEKGEVKIENGSPRANGTGFFVMVQKEGTPGGHVYFVTAKHVLKDEKGNFFKRIFLRVNDRNNGSGMLPLDLIQDGDGQNVFVHEDSTVDVAVIPGLPNENVFDFLTIPDSLIKSREDMKKSTLRPGSDVFFTGLFAPHVGEKKNVPIFRFGRVAMFTDDRVRWQEAGKAPESVELYLLETMSFGGNSGSPVFFSQGMDREPGSIILGADEISLAGVMRGNFNEPRPGAFIQSQNSLLPVFAQNIGIAAVTPAYLLRDILYSEKLKSLRVRHPVPPEPAKP